MRSFVVRANRFTLLAIVVLLVSASGASCPNMLQQYTQPLARALPPEPTLEQVMNVVNCNGGQVQSLYTSQASVTMPGSPTALRAHGRLPARSAISACGPTRRCPAREMDLGSNDELFWFWVKRNQPPAFYFCRHDQFAASAARQILPVEPTWLPRALGVVTLDPGGHYQGPTPISAGRLEIRTLPGHARRKHDRHGGRCFAGDRAGRARLRLGKATGWPRPCSAGISATARPASRLPRHVELQFRPRMHLEIGIELKDLANQSLAAARRPICGVKPTYQRLHRNRPGRSEPAIGRSDRRGGLPHAPPQKRGIDREWLDGPRLVPTASRDNDATSRRWLRLRSLDVRRPQASTPARPAGRRRARSGAEQRPATSRLCVTTTSIVCSCCSNSINSSGDRPGPSSDRDCRSARRPTAAAAD